MSDSPRGRAERAFRIALAASVLLHLALLLAPLISPKAPPPSAPRLTARLEPRTVPPPQAAPAPSRRATPTPRRAPVPESSRRMITSERGTVTVPVPAPEAPRKFSAAEKAEMDQFLESLEAEKPVQPSLAQRSAAQAREIGREIERPPQRAGARDVPYGPIVVERIPDTPELDPFSLEMYLESLVNKLNRTSAFVKRESRRAGVRRGIAELRLNPDGTIRSFEVLDAADQQDEVAYLNALVNRAAPYSPFPPDIVRSAKTMAILICILPATESRGVGFTRMSGGKGC